MKRLFVSMFLVLVVLAVVLGCENKNNANTEINTSPLNYLSFLRADVNFFQNLSFDDKVKVMTKKKYVSISNSQEGTKEGVSFENDKVIINIKGSTLTFSNSSDEKLIAATE